MKMMTTKTRIVATIGPQNASVDAISELLKAGMAMVRLNGSHNTLKWHEETIKQIQKVSANIPILLTFQDAKLELL